MKKLLIPIISAFLVASTVYAINLASFNEGDRFTQKQVNKADLQTVGMDVALVKKQVNDGSFDVVFTYKAINATTTGYMLNTQTATTSYSVTEYKNCRAENTKARCKRNVKTKLIAKAKALLESERQNMRQLQSAGALNVYQQELSEITITSSDIE